MRRLAPFVLLVGLTACGDISGGDDDDDDGADAGATFDASPRPDAGSDPVFETAAGTIRLTETVGIDYDGNPFTFSRADAQFGDADTPSFHTETMRSGACRLLEFETSLCEPYCSGICLPGNNCVEYPSYLNVGTITITGLTEALALAADPPLNWYNPTQWPIPEDLFAPGSEITATAAGGTDLPAFEVTAYGVSPMVADIGDANITIVDGQDFTLSWTPAADGARVRLTLNSPNRGHGLPLEGIIECDAPDTGSLTIPGEMITAFPDAQGNTICVGHDCPPSYLTRYTRGSVAVGDDEVELVVGAEFQFATIHE